MAGYDFAFIKEGNSIPTRITPNEKKIYKNITIQNTGTNAWPETSYLYPLTPSKGQLCKLAHTQAGKEVSTIVILENPGIAGDFSTSWAFAFKNLLGETVNVGNSFNITLKVESDPNSQEKPAPEQPKQKKETENDLKGYPEKVKATALKMKKIFPQRSAKELADFTLQYPDLGFEELVTNLLN
jgi:hypothetical protein